MTVQILVTSDDGPEATGLQVLLDSIQLVWPGAKPVTIVPSNPVSGTAMSLTPGWEAYMKAEAKELAPRVFSVDLTPTDIIYRAFLQREEFSGRDWDLVLVGCNHGANLGFDVFHSGTCGAAMTAARAFGTAAFAFSQDFPVDKVDQIVQAKVDRNLFRTAEKVIPDFLRKQAPDAGVCWNVNIPEEAQRGYKQTKVAHYSYHRTPPTKMVPRAAVEDNDIHHLTQGWVTVSPLELRVNPNLKF